MLPADQDIARTGIPVHDVLDALGIVAITGCVHCETQIFGQWFDGIVGALTLSIYRKSD
jgi:hypothetical protein